MDDQQTFIKAEEESIVFETNEELTVVPLLSDVPDIISAIEVTTDTDGHFKISTIEQTSDSIDDEPREIALEIEAEEYDESQNIDYTLEEQEVEQEDEDQNEVEEMEEDADDPDYEYPYDNKEKEMDEYHACEFCDRCFKTATSLKRHVTVTHSEDRPSDDPLAFELCYCCGEPVDSAHMTGDITCPNCDKRFVFEENLSRHMCIDHNKGDLYNCSECKLQCNSKQELIDHLAVHPLSKPFSCKACNKDFTRKYHLDRHIAQTGCDGGPKNNFQCNVCYKEFARKDNLRDHLRAHAGQTKKKKVFVCMYCEKVFQGSGLLSVHLRTHTGERPYACDLCPKRFPSSGAMKKHRRMHTGEKPYECSRCQKRFAAKETLNRHIRTHTGDKPHSCHFCGKSFIQAAQLRAHIFHHTGENAFTCPHCNRAFNRRVRLTTHIQFVHEGAQPMQCDHCTKSFYRREDLQRHLLLHTGVKPFQCEVCNKKFAVKSSLKLHMLTHRKEPPCSCDECGRAFIRQDCLLRHMRAKHRDVLEDIMAGAEKKRLQEQLLNVAQVVASGNNTTLTVQQSTIWDELTLTDSIKELLGLLVDESTLKDFGWPDTPVDKMLDSVIRRCGHKPASKEDFDYIGRMRENAKLLFTVVIDDDTIKSLLNNQTVDEVILHVLRLAKND
ncbi:zinc finger protein 436-like [Onthophagus taurus]|uniref:zinc finger protein 436-like n=1 Tax=Onthophagus taurus TaxID=166361 RepID=UPI000C20B704|nr:protein suppressor of hairy wing-like [Onthophagus taurus]